MDKNVILGKLKEARGTVTKALGEAVGSEKLKADGVADQFVGAAQNALGKIKDEYENGRDEEKLKDEVKDLKGDV